MQPRSDFSTKDEERLKAYATLSAQIIQKRRIGRLLELDLEQRLDLVQDRQDIEAKERAAFLAMVSHELRTPLHQMSGFIDLLHNRTFDGDAQREEYFRYLVEGVKQMSDLTESALKFAAADFGRLPMKRTPFCLKDVADPGLRAIDHSADLSSLVAFTVYADVSHFTQIFMSIGTAFSDAGVKELSVEAEEEEETVGVSVRIGARGTSAGLPFSENVFDPLSSFDSTLGRGQQGFELDLAFANRLAKAQGARLAIEGEGGTTQKIVLTIPGYLLQSQQPGTSAA